MGFMLEKERTGATPLVIIDEAKNYMRFEGKSFSENASDFYGDIMVWLDEYLNSDFASFTFDCDLVYFNSSTAKLLYIMLRNMDKTASGGKDITVNWIADKSNAVAVEFAEDFLEEMDHLNFNLILK